MIWLTCNHGQVFKTGQRPTSSRTITSKETVVEKNWLENKKHQINPHTEVDTSSNEEPSSAEIWRLESDYGSGDGD
jgi:hypothetical protein